MAIVSVLLGLVGLVCMMGGAIGRLKSAKARNRRIGSVVLFIGIAMEIVSILLPIPAE